MIVTSFVYCDHIEMHPVNGPKNQVYHLVQPLQLLALYAIPGVFSFAISFGLQGDELRNKGNTCRIDLCDDQGQNIIAIAPQTLPESEDDGPAVNDHGVCMNLDLRNVVFNKRGIHKAKLYFNEDIVGEYPILVTTAK